MKTGTGHIAVTIHPYEQTTLSLGRAHPAEPVAIVDVDVRAGRSFEQGRTFATHVMNGLSDRWDVPTENMYCVYTEHKGEDFMLAERALSDWSSDEETDGVQPWCYSREYVYHSASYSTQQLIVEVSRRNA